jgi:hypothetical protein
MSTNGKRKNHNPVPKPLVPARSAVTEDSKISIGDVIHSNSIRAACECRTGAKRKKIKSSPSFLSSCPLSFYCCFVGCTEFRRSLSRPLFSPSSFSSFPSLKMSDTPPSPRPSMSSPFRSHPFTPAVLTLEKARSLAKSVNGTCTGIQRAHDRSVYRQQLLEEKEPLPCGADNCPACLNHQGAPNGRSAFFFFRDPLTPPQALPLYKNGAP